MNQFQNLDLALRYADGKKMKAGSDLNKALNSPDATPEETTELINRFIEFFWLREYYESCKEGLSCLPD